MDAAASTLPRRRRVWLKRTLLALGCLVLACVVFAVWTGVRMVNTMLAMEDRLHAVIAAGFVVDEFITSQDPPRWPRSWDELKTVEASWSRFEWPRDRDEIESRVIIDFDTTLADVARSERDTFDAIRPNGLSYSRPGDIWFVVEDARKLTVGQADPRDSEGG